MKKAIVVALVLLAILAGGIGAWLSLGGDDAPAVRPYTVARGDVVETAAASGTIEPHVQVEVKSRASGEVIEVLVAEGDTVSAGDPLVRLDPADTLRALRQAEVAAQRASADVAQARASLAVAQAEQGEAGANRDVQERGAELGLVSEEQRRGASHSANVARGNAALRRAQLASANAALMTAQLGVEDAQRRLTEMEIRAPIDGTVLSVPIERGSIVSSAVTSVSGGTALLTIADLSDLRIVGAIDEAQIGRVGVDQAVVIRVDAYPDREFGGRVTRVSPLGTTEANVVTFDVEIAILDPQASLLRSGMSADLEIVTVRREGALLIPITAVHSRGPARFVWLTSGAERRVETGATDGTQTEVLSGLREGDTLDLAVRAQAVPERASGPIPMGPRGGRPR